MRTLIKNAWILTMDEVMSEFQSGYLVIQDDLIADLGFQVDLVESGASFDQVIDAKGGLLMPGMINTHTHTPMIPFRSLGDDMPDRLRKLLFPLEKYMTPDLVRKSSRYALAEMALSGITTFGDMYYFVEEIAKSTHEIGLRGLIGQTVINQPTCDAQTPQDACELFEQFAQKYHDDELVTPIIAPHATNTNTKEGIEACLTLVKKYQTLMMMHVSEMDYEQSYFKENYEKTPVAWLEELGVLDEPFILVHGIHLNQEDLALLQMKPKSSIAHCVIANAKSAKGVAPIKEALAHEIIVGLGTDGPSSGNTLEMFSQMRQFATIHKNHYHERNLFPAKEIVKLVTCEAAKVVRMADKIGSLEVGKKADITLIETKSVNMFPIYDPYAALVYSANASNVSYVWANGQLIVQDKMLISTDEIKLKEDLEIAMTEFVHHIPEDC